jgi:hypothetical protein
MLLNPVLSQNGFGVSLQTVSGSLYVMEANDTLDASTWQVVASVAGDGTLQVLVDSGPAGPVRFYRVRVE